MSGNSRRNWTLSISIALVLAVAAVVIGNTSGDKDIETDRIYLTSTAGAVLFDHGKHQESIGDCASCHHDLLSSSQDISCAECHDDEVDPEDFDHDELKEIHERDCQKCHEQIAADEEAASCRDCHKPTVEGNTGFLGCMSCHDDDYTPDMMTHVEYLEVEDHTCEGCHTPETISETYHANCTQCHLQAAPAQFADAEGKTVCGACHLR